MPEYHSSIDDLDVSPGDVYYIRIGGYQGRNVGPGTLTITTISDPTCPADTDGNGVVDVIDLLAVIDGWGTDSSDFNDDGTTDVIDLLAVIDGWGYCD